MPTILVAVSGMSPAILTETIWALAQESPPVVPDEVVVITTSRGEQDIQQQLLTPLEAWGGQTVWAKLREDIFAGARLPKENLRLQLSPRVIDLPDAATGVRQKADDLRTHAQNDAAANFIVQTLAPYCDAQDHQVIASIAGGRKTMGALLYGAMSLLGKETDRVTHVLVSEPFEFIRGFYYPGQPGPILEFRPFNGPPAPADPGDAVVELADLPFVPLRNKFEELNEPRRTFAGLVDCYARAERPLQGSPAVTLDAANGILSVQGKPILLVGRCLVVASFLYEQALAGQAMFEDVVDAAEAYLAFVRQWQQQYPHHRKTSRYIAGKAAKEDITRSLSELRTLLKKNNVASCIPFLAPARSRIGFDIHRDTVRDVPPRVG